VSQLDIVVARNPGRRPELRKFSTMLAPEAKLNWCNLNGLLTSWGTVPL